jgi:hypothetical protein
MDKPVVEHRPILLSCARNTDVLNNAAVIIKMGLGQCDPIRAMSTGLSSLEKLKKEWAKFTKQVFYTLQEQLEEADADASEEPRNLDRDEESQDG